jgi:tRNA-dihydrouridine synthase
MLLQTPLFILAPMDDVTDTVFRRIVAECAAPDMFFTEFVSVDGLQSPGRQRLMKKLQFTTQEQPLVAQIWGKNPENYYKTAQALVEMGFKGIDINMGCPVKVVVNNGCCSALIDNRPLAVEIIKATQEGAAGNVPVSVKTRLGGREIDFTWHELLLQQKLDMLTIHGRTRVQMSGPPANWEAINEVRKLRDSLKLNTLIIGNGDVESREQGLTLAKQYQLDGIMVGRGVFHDPFVFAKRSGWKDYTKEQRIGLYKHHVELFREAWGEAGERRISSLNRFCKIYIQGFDGAKELREHLMACRDYGSLLGMLEAALPVSPAS